MIIIADNRSIAHQCFHTDAAYASYYRNVAALVGKYCAVIDRHHWVHRLKFLAVAISPEKVRLIHSAEWSISQLPYLLEPRYTCVGSIQETTWGRYFVDALNKVSQALPSAECATIVLISTDMCLLGDRGASDIDHGLDKFCAACHNLRKLHPAAKVTILCAIVSENTNKDHYFASPNTVKMQIKLQQLSSFVTFRGVKNSNLHFEEQLHRLVSSLASPLHGKLDLPAFCGTNCSIVYELHASTMDAQSALHDGLCSPVLCGLVPRAGVDAGFIDGCALHLHAPAHNQAVDMLPTENSRRYNSLTMQGFARWLLAKDLLALLRMSFSHRAGRIGSAGDSGAAAIASDQYWALVPPVRAASAKGEPYWVLLKLVDHDDLLPPQGTEASSGSCAGGASVRAVSPIPATPAQNAPLSASSEALVPPRCDAADTGDAGGELYWHQDPDQDKEILEDIQEYLEGSLVATLGAAVPYDPLAHPSGSINAMFESLRRVQGTAQRNGGQGPSPVVSPPPAVPATPAPSTAHAAAVVAPRTTQNAARGAGSAAKVNSTAAQQVPAPAQGMLALTSKSSSSATASASATADPSSRGKAPAPPPAATRTAPAGSKTKKRTIDASFFPELSGGANTAQAAQPQPPAGQGSVQHTMPKRGPGRPSAAEKSRAMLLAQIADAEREEEVSPTAAPVPRSASTAVSASSAPRQSAPSAVPAAAPHPVDSSVAPTPVESTASMQEPAAPPRFFKRRFSGAAPAPWRDT